MPFQLFSSFVSLCPVSPPSQHSKPSHPERTTYDRDFLLRFKDLAVCKDAPPQLVNTECFRSSNSAPFM